jgi:hypothetical protein
MGLEWTDILVSAIKALPTLSEHIFFNIIATSPHTLLVLLHLVHNSVYFSLQVKNKLYHGVWTCVFIIGTLSMGEWE